MDKTVEHVEVKYVVPNVLPKTTVSLVVRKSLGDATKYNYNGYVQFGPRRKYFTNLRACLSYKSAKDSANNKINNILQWFFDERERKLHGTKND